MKVISVIMIPKMKRALMILQTNNFFNQFLDLKKTRSLSLN